MRAIIANRRLVLACVVALIAAGAYVSPTALLPWDIPRAPLHVDALPDLGENQQIVFTEWPGHSPQDVDDEITHPLTAALLGMPGVRTVRGSSMFGASSIYVIFEETVDFHWSRSRIAERLASLPPDTLPANIKPQLGPDATALGQVFWYTLDGRNEKGRAIGGWDLHELRSIHDSTIRLALQSVTGVAEVASVGGYVKEIQVDVDPDALQKHGVDLEAVVSAVRQSNMSVGARTLEVNGVEYVLRGIGQIRAVADLEDAVVQTRNKGRVALRDVAHVALGPALRRGALDDGGGEAVGGVVVSRFGANPLEVIAAVKRKISEIAPALPARVVNGEQTKVSITPFYDRSVLIAETLDTLSSSLWQQILVTLITVLILLRNLRGGLLISAVLPLSVIASLVAMKLSGLEVNFMALAGIAIAIGTMVDMAIVLTENIVSRLRTAGDTERRSDVIAAASAEVAPALFTAGITTAVSFLPVLAFTGAEGKLLRPMAYSKTFAMFAAMIVSLLVLPALASIVFRRMPRFSSGNAGRIGKVAVVAITGVVLIHDWMPLGTWRGFAKNGSFVVALLAALFSGLWAFRALFTRVLGWSLRHKIMTLGVPALLMVGGAFAWRSLGREFMPPFDEGAYLYMPSMTDHGSITESLGMLREMDAAIQTIPEIDRVVGKLGRVDSALDPAPTSMFESLITYKPEYRTDAGGAPVRQWRDHIKTPEDIWREITRVAQTPGLTSAPRLMPIATRVLMLQTGLRAALGIKLYGPDLATLEAFGVRLEKHLKEVPELRAESVFAERIIGKPAISIELDRQALREHGVTVAEAQGVVETALGGTVATRVTKDRERYAARVRYLRERRDNFEAVAEVQVPAAGGKTVALSTLAHIRYQRTPQVIRSENGQLQGYIVFDKQADVAEVDAVEAARAALDKARQSGALSVPAGVRYEFSGSYENHVHSQKRLGWLVPIALLIMVLLVHLEFRRLAHTLIVVSGIGICMSGGFVLVWLYGKPWFFNLSLFGLDFREAFQIGTVNMSIAVWVGFIALLGIATDAGVVMGIYLKNRFAEVGPTSVAEIHRLALEAAARRVLPCLMTTAAAALSLLPMFTSHGRGSDFILPMALPSVGGMATILLTLFTVPVLFVWLEERRLGRGQHVTSPNAS